MNDDADFVAAIRANPDDNALRLVYADWLEERGDPRGELLRLDTSLARKPAQAQRGSPHVNHLREMRRTLDRDWVLTVGRSGFGEVEVLELPKGSSSRYEYLEDPDWLTIETALRRLDRAQHWKVGLLITAAFEQDYFDITGGEGMYCLTADIDHRFRRYLDPSKARQPVVVGLHYSGIRSAQEICYGLETVLRAAKYVYYYREFPPDLPYTNDHR